MCYYYYYFFFYFHNVWRRWHNNTILLRHLASSGPNAKADLTEEKLLTFLKECKKNGGVHERHQNPDQLSSQARCQYLTLRAAAVRGGCNTCADDEHLPFSQNTEHHTVWQTLPRGKRGFTCFLLQADCCWSKSRSQYGFWSVCPLKWSDSERTCALWGISLTWTCFWLTTTFKAIVAYYFWANFSFS